jgi:hypothetical protein
MFMWSDHVIITAEAWYLLQIDSWNPVDAVAQDFQKFS